MNKMLNFAMFAVSFVDLKLAIGTIFYSVE